MNLFLHFQVYTNFDIHILNEILMLCSLIKEMWYNVFLWALFSSLFIHGVAAVVAFLTLRKHAVGRYITCTFTLYTSY